jgi:hypothetical protein
MLVKINSINEIENKVKVSMLDIDDYGSIVVLKEIELNLPQYDKSIINILKNSPYAAIFTEFNDYDNEKDTTIILASGITYDEIDREKKKVIEMSIYKKRKI